MQLISILESRNIPHTNEGGKIHVPGHLDLSGTAITNVAYKSGCGRESRRIFAARVNGEIQIGAGCFLGNLDKFCAAVDESYSGDEAEQYKADARECVDALVGMGSVY